MGIIILNIVVIIVCLIAVILQIADRRFDTAIPMGILTLFYILLLSYCIQVYKVQNEELQKYTVENVVKFSIDTTTVIVNQDTTKTYNITYWK